MKTKTISKTATGTRTKTLVLTALGGVAIAAAVLSLGSLRTANQTAIGGTVIGQGIQPRVPKVWADWGSKPAGYVKRPAPNLDAWLAKTENKDLANDILFYEPDLKTGLYYPDWSAAQKKELQDMFTESWNWFENGAPTEAFDPPPRNVFFDICVTARCKSADVDPRVFLSRQDAKRLYLQAVADNLAAEIGGWFPWRVNGEQPKERVAAFYDLGGPRFGLWAAPSIKESVFKAPLAEADFKGDLGGYVVGIQGLTDARPRAVLGFLRDRQLIGQTRRDSIDLFLGWAKRFQHSSGLPDYQNYYATWQYYGGPPLSRVLMGTQSQAPDVKASFPQAENWTDGCLGSDVVYRAVLGSQLIPVERNAVCGHRLSTFPTEGLMLSHSDDPYSQTTKTIPATADELLVTQQYFDAYLNGNCGNVGRRSAELSVKYISGFLLDLYCTDLAAKRTKDDGLVFGYLKNFFSLQQLDAAKLWYRLDQRKAYCTTFEAKTFSIEPSGLPYRSGDRREN